MHFKQVQCASLRLNRVSWSRPMTIAPTYSPFDVVYPESDGLPMAESDITRDYLLYTVEALDRYFRADNNVYISGFLAIYLSITSRGIPNESPLQMCSLFLGSRKKSGLPTKLGKKGSNCQILFWKSPLKAPPVKIKATKKVSMPI